MSAAWGLYHSYPIRATAVLAVVFNIVICYSTGEAEDVAPESVAEQRIGRLIEQLGSPIFDERESATKELIQTGISAQKQLKSAKRHASPEVRSRATNILKQFHEIPLGEAFRLFAKQPEEKLNVEEGMWLIARILNPDVDRASLNKSLDTLADKVRTKLGENEVPKLVSPERIVKALCEVLFVVEGFQGNANDYENPNNSSLEKVLETRKGLPILLSHVVVAVAERLEVPIVGVPTLGRYTVKYDGRRAPTGAPQADIHFDPYDHGKILNRSDRLRMFPGTDPDQVPDPGSKRDVLIRMLNNIETHLFNRDEADKAELAVVFRVALQQSTDLK